MKRRIIDKRKDFLNSILFFMAGLVIKIYKDLNNGDNNGFEHRAIQDLKYETQIIFLYSL